MTRTQKNSPSNTPSKNSRSPKEIYNKISKLDPKDTLVIFDLDSTLFDVSPRLEKVLIDIANEPEITEKFPDVIPHFKNIKAERHDWGFVEVLKRAGVDHDHHQLFRTVKSLWAQKFFSNDYIHYDVPYEGAVSFVQKIYSLGVRLAYLTGRDVFRMERGSRDVLKKWGFPVDTQNAELVLKPQKGLDDALFKKEWIENQIKTGYSSVFLFENEPVNINLIAQTLPLVELVFFLSTHSGKQLPPNEIDTLIHYLLEEDPS